MKKKTPNFKSDRAKAAFVDKVDLSQYDLSGAQLVRFEIKRKDKSINLRLSEELYDAVRKRSPGGPALSTFHSLDAGTGCQRTEIRLLR